MSDVEKQDKILEVLESLSMRQSTPEWKKPSYWGSIIALCAIAIAVVSWFSTIFVDDRINSILEEYAKTTQYSIDKKYNFGKGVVENGRDLVEIKRSVTSISEKLDKLLNIVEE